MAMRDTTSFPLSERQDTILDAAFHAFATYGYRRTSMDDIAKGAGLSRSALYLTYRNKEDIFRSLAIRYFDEAIRDMAGALASSGQSPEQALLAAFVAKDGKFMEAVLSTPHGEELTPTDVARSIIAAVKGLKTSVRSMEEYREGQARLARLFARAIS
ncbi:MAG: hypothetical protein RLZZ563_275 [Pseudomonadota bacterium]